MPTYQSANNESGIVFYDGECGVCNRFVQFLLQRDSAHTLHYAPLQGSTAAEMLTADEVKNIDTIVLLRKGQSYRKSTAVLKVVAGLGGSYSLAAIALLVPRFFRDYLYDLFAKRRKKISLACRLLTADERRRFLP